MDTTKTKNLIYNFETLEFPPDATEEDIAYISRNKSKFYLTKHGLYYKNNRKILNKHEAESAFQQYHYHPLGGHFAAANTWYKISEKYCWDNMQETITEWVKSCQRCQAKGKEAIQEELHPISVKKQPYQMVAMDIKHVETSRGNHKYIVVAIDCFTKYVEVRPLICANSLEIMSFFIEDIM